MTLLDTSIFIALFRRRHLGIGERVKDLIIQNEAYICGQVWVEYLGGFRSASRRKMYAEQLSSLPWLSTTREAFEFAADLQAMHQSLNSADAIIAATAILQDAQLLTIDKDFASLREYGVEIVELN
ncbi:MAG: PIN domain-containing protein [Phycisphaerae bacterium]|nr:PIN domain-containing protein [Phycisphaerae bacterium]